MISSEVRLSSPLRTLISLALKSLSPFNLL
nr:MAG TPA: hypothetical protein [Caudoviricetes sp.]